MRSSLPLILAGIVFLVWTPQLVHSQSSSFPSLDISVPTFSDMQGERIREAAAGQQIMIQEAVRNDIYLDEDKVLTLLLEVRDQNGVTIFLAWQSSTVSPNDTFSFGTSWIVPDDAATGMVYEARTFALTFIGNEAEPLSMVLNSEITVG